MNGDELLFWKSNDDEILRDLSCQGSQDFLDLRICDINDFCVVGISAWRLWAPKLNKTDFN